MQRVISRTARTALKIACILGVSFSTTFAGAIIADHSVVGEFSQIPTGLFSQIRSNYSLFYGHTSHGSQIVSGIEMLETENSLYATPTFYEVTGDLGVLGDTSWAPRTRRHLDANPGVNVVMWSWCGGQAGNNVAGALAYCEAYAGLEVDYPGVTFVYMTGPIDGSGPDGRVHVNNDVVRDFCYANDKVLFDFADIESYDPDGTHYPLGHFTCNWCSAWCATHNCPSCQLCAHTHCFNCYVKGKAFWWMMARITGWSQQPTDVGDDGGSLLPEQVELRQNFPNPFNSGTKIEIYLSRSSEIELSVFNILGERIITLFEGSLSGGEHSFFWDGKDADGHSQSSGIYLYRAVGGEISTTRKMLLLK